MRLTDLYRLPRAGRYSRPRRAAATLPLVYGDLTDAEAGGAIEAVCIDTGYFVYAIAGHAVLSVGDGNNVTVYDKDGNDITANFIFSDSNNYESQGAIATLTSTAGDQEANEPLGVSFMGAASGGSLLENPIDQAAHMLELTGVGSDALDSVAQNRAWNICDAAGYVLGPVFTEDGTPGQMLTDIMSCVLGSWRRGPNDRVVLSVRTGTNDLSEYQVAAAIPAKKLNSGFKVSVRLSDIVNQPALDYRYNWLIGDYEATDDGSGAADETSQNVYGVRQKNYQFPFIRTSTVAGAVQDAVVALYSSERGLFMGKLDGGERMGLEPGDLIAVSLDWLFDTENQPLRNQLLLVEEATGQFTDFGVYLKALDTGAWMTAPVLADGTYYADGTQLAGAQRNRDYVEF